MSDLYDSLEDESNEKNISCGSLGGCESDALDFTPKGNRNESTACTDPFYLYGNLKEEHPNSSRSHLYDNTAFQKKNLLPKMDKPTKGWDGTPNLIVDSKVLREQGLQINNDGSFTKSPRPPAEELPFITREYRNLQFQKKKTYKSAKKNSRTKIYKKNIFSFTKNPVDGISMNKIINARQEKGSSEEILTSAGSLSSLRGKPPSQVLGDDNLTDSMKEKLLQTNRNTPCETLKVVGSLKKTKRVMNLLEAGKASQQNRIFCPRVKSPRKSNADPNQVPPRNESSLAKLKPRILGSGKLRPEAAINDFKPCLSYSERRQLESGFEPSHLRLGSKKVMSDTNRSNFGDSVADRLSEISGRVLSCENLRDEGEEDFYRELMEKGKSQKHDQRSTRSEEPCQFPKVNSSFAAGSKKKQNEAKQNNLKFKPISKSMSIDLPSQAEDVSRTLKKYHYCSVDSSPNLSKFELALKAKTYGYLANARNIFKMKAQSEGKLTPKDDNENLLACDLNSNSADKTANRIGGSKTFSSRSTLPHLPENIRRAFEKPTTKKTSGLIEESLGEVGLPRILDAEKRDAKIKTEILNRMSLCLNSPKGRTEDVVTSMFN